MRMCDIKSGLSKFCDKIYLGLRGDRKIVEYLYVSLGKIEEIDIPASKKRLRVESLSIKAPMLEVELKSLIEESTMVCSVSWRSWIVESQSLHLIIGILRSRKMTGFISSAT